MHDYMIAVVQINVIIQYLYIEDMVNNYTLYVPNNINSYRC